MNLYVIRHGKTDWNNKFMLSNTDLQLNDEGVKQAKNAAKIVDNLDYDILISSPLLRTKQTAKIINNKNLKPVIYDDRIIERNAGVLEGKDINLDIFKDYWNYNLNLKYEGAECVKEFMARVYDFLEDILKRYKDKNILIVTHNGVCRAIRTYFNGILNKGKLKDIGQDNCEIKMYKV